MTTTEVAVDRLTTHPQNPRKGSVEAIKQSLTRFGQTRPIVVNRDNTILAGNHTYKAAQELGWTAINVAFVDLEPDEALAYVLADNRTSDIGTYDDTALIKALEDLASKDLLDGIGYTYGDIDDLQAALDNVTETAVETFEGGYAEDPELTAQRISNVQGGTMREVVFLLPPDEFNAFVEHVNVLKHQYELESSGQAIARAVANTADALTSVH